ncbi:uncharacterized protein KGF55_001147 [Candida pseudojiufengensis]|uniref:uncharacterized protein n=1 Tax=Candida pseudojiufengensis TaxID=497109 RepID=UPI0022250057|nr:uncharacterized protein KGF55_001147 [Candida pseudojiufengensis]KAI5965784.1 hypothetical protein KGF55_001147 [Candida pseudojiufengensis]
MQVFLKLPKEILSLIFRLIEERSIIESLILIPGLQHIALERKYSTFEINNNNKSIEKLLSLFQKYEFIPSIIIGDLNQINELIVEPAFRLANYEVKILPNTRFSDFVSILNKVYITGIQLDSYLESFVGLSKKNEIQSFLNYVGSNNLQSLTTSHLNMFKVQFPTSLKQITINGGQNFELDLSNLQYLESFECKDLLQMSSLENLKLSQSIKNLKLDSCEFKSLGNLIKYNKLKLLHISYCPEIYDIAYNEFPDSLKILDFINNFKPSRIAELNEEEGLILSEDDLRVVVYSYPPNLEKLRIFDTMQTLEIEDFEISKSLNCLELKGIGEFNLSLVLDNLPRRMSEIIIENCRVVYSDYEVSFPESKQIKFTNNKICFDPFFTNLNQLKLLEELEISDNICPDFDDAEYPFDPLISLSHMETAHMEKVCFNTPQLQNLILKSPTPPDQDDYMFSCEVLFNCKNLTKINMINLDICFLNINEFCNQLIELVIKNSKIQAIHGNFSNLDKLKILDLQNNKFTFSMLENQNFPSSLISLNLSNNKLEDLNCLKLDNCVHLHNLTLKKVTAKDKPEGAIQLMELCMNLPTAAKFNAILTNYSSRVIFKIVDGVKKKSIKHKRRKICKSI